MATRCGVCMRHDIDAHRPAPDVSVWRAVWRIAYEAELDAKAGQIAFSAVFSIGPLVSLTLMLLSTLPTPAIRDNLYRLLHIYAPAATYPFLDSITRSIKRPGSPFLLVGSILVLLWSLSTATSAVLRSLEDIGASERASYLHTRLRAVLLGFSAAAGFAFSAVAVTLGPGVVAVFNRVLHLHLPVPEILSLGWIRIPLSGMSFMLVAGLFLTFGTTHRPRHRATAQGAVFTGVVAALASAALSAYLTWTPRLGGGYGAATSFFGVLLWLYVVGIALLLGAALTHVLDVRQRDTEAGPGAAGGARRPRLHHRVIHALRSRRRPATSSTA